MGCLDYLADQLPFEPKNEGSWDLVLIGILLWAIANLLCQNLLADISRFIKKILLWARSLPYKNNQIVFQDMFDAGNKGWNLNFWGSKDPDKTNRIEEGVMLFEANENELEKPEKGYGAYLDLTHGISKGNKYKIECKALSGENSTMAFRLWLHDTREAHPVSSSFYKLSDKPKTISLYFAASETNAVRIHLHAKPGFGKIMVKEVTVREVE